MPTAPTPTNLNFSDTDPPAPAGRSNGHWLASEPPYSIPVNINGVIQDLLFRDVSVSFPNPGGPGSSAQTVYEIPLAPSAPGNFTVPHGLPAAPMFVLIQMSSGGAIWLQNPVGFDATNLYLVASDAGVTGFAACFTALPDAVVPLAPTAPGNFTVAHGLSSAPALVLIGMTSGGAIWDQSPAWDATNLYLTASDAGVTGNAYVWLAVPSIQIISFANIPLAPSAPGKFTVAHGLPATPAVIIIRMKTGGAIWLQEPAADSTNLYLVASDAGIMGYAEAWTNGGGGSGLDNPQIVSAVAGIPTANQIVMIFTAAVKMTFPANFASPNSYGSVGVNPASTAVYSIYKNGTLVGNISVSTSGIFTFSTIGAVAFSLAPGDRLTMTAPSPADAAISDVGVTLVAVV